MTDGNKATPRVLVVRSGERSFPTSSARGIEVVERVTHSIENVPVDPSGFAGPFDVTLFTSVTAVERFFADSRLAARLGERVVGVGPATAAAVRARGVARVEEAAGSSARILDRLDPAMPGVRVLLPRGEDASGELPRELSRRGAQVLELTLYRKVRRPYDPALDTEILTRPFEAVVATSPSAARWLFEGAGGAARHILRRTPWVALGPMTLQTLEDREVDAIAIVGSATLEAAARLAASLAAHHRAK